MRYWVLAILCAYIILGIALAVFQDSLIFIPPDPEFEDCKAFEAYERKEFNGTRFYFKNGSDAAIVYYHGNADSACHGARLKENMERTGMTLIVVEYAGYSGDKRSPSIELLKQDVRNIHAFTSDMSGNYVIGRSLGTGAASYHASQGNVDKLFLISPYSRLSDVAQEYIKIYPAALMMKNDLDNIALLKDFDGELLIMHGDRDGVVPARLSQRLYSGVDARKRYVLLSGKGHNDLWRLSARLLKSGF
jgi:uncharacterized protein